MEFLFKEIGLTIGIGIITFMMGIIFSWAKKGSKHCENHSQFLLSVDRLNISVNQLVTTSEELFKKIDKMTDKLISLENRMCIVEVKQEAKKN
jgi:hypothetical protein